MKKLEYLFLVMIFLCASCAKDQLFDPPDTLPGNSSPYNLISPQIRIAVVSDIHYLDPSLMPDDYVNNPDFQADMSVDRKLIELSDPIFRKAMSELIAEKPDILLITGDLAREGEMKSHETMQGFLQQIENEGIKVYVVPGNNDILNSAAESFKTVPSTPVSNITLADFESLYQNFGYNEALYRDANSLSYICQPYDHLWILGIDACRYVDDEGTLTVEAAISDGTMAWIEEKMVEARENNIRVLAMMHFGIMEHYAGQSKLEGAPIENYQDRAIALMNAGIRLIFTGHLHGNDITDFTNTGKTLTDIETGSLVTPKSPYRVMVLDDNFIKIETSRITNVNADIPGGRDFLAYSDSTIKSHFDNVCYRALKYKFGVPGDKALIMAPFFTRAFMAHFAGDEKMPPAERKTLDNLAKIASPKLMPFIYSMWTDLPPYSDNKIHIKLK
jgi:3',5'-cyclic AMP phosphodiesterase CpdA